MAKPIKIPYRDNRFGGIHTGIGGDSPGESPTERITRGDHVDRGTQLRLRGDLGRRAT